VAPPRRRGQTRCGLEQRVNAVDIGLAQGRAVEGKQVVHCLPFHGWGGARLGRQAALVPAIVTSREQQPQPEQHAQGAANEPSAPDGVPLVVDGKPQHTEHWMHRVSLIW